MLIKLLASTARRVFGRGHFAKSPADAQATRSAGAGGPDLRAARVLETNRLLDVGDIRAASALLAELLALDPDDADALYLRGKQQVLEGREDAARELFERAATLNPDLAPAHYELARYHDRRDDYLPAIDRYRVFLRLAPESAEAHSNLGLLLFKCERFDEAVACWARAIELRADFAAAHFNLAIAKLHAGDLAVGWREYEWRPGQPAPGTAAYARRRWEGSPFPGRRLLVTGEQGLGDVLMFARFLPMARARGGEVILQCDPRLIRLLRGAGVADRLVPTGTIGSDDARGFDLQLPMMSLPLALNIGLDDLPGPVPYLEADGELATAFAAKVGGSAAFKVGIAWAGNPAQTNDRNRSLQPRLFGPLASLRGTVDFYSLQVGPGAVDLPGFPFPMIDLTTELHDLADTAALMANLDLVITADTAPVHLAGALGKPVWLLRPNIADWRWRIGERPSPWYPHVRVFRQPQIGRWEPVMDEIARALAREACGDRERK